MSFYFLIAYFLPLFNSFQQQLDIPAEGPLKREEAAMPQQGTPTAPNSNVPEICQHLSKPEYLKIVKQLTGNELILFCSIYDDTQRDQVLALTKSNPQNVKIIKEAKK
jgi:hypothetical protein